MFVLPLSNHKEMDQGRLNSLLKKYHEDSLSSQEKAELDDWFHGLNLGGTEFADWVEQMGGEASYIENRFEDFQSRISENRGQAKIRYIQRIAAAASILLVLSFGGYFILHKTKQVQPLARNQFHDIMPGGNKAILTLDGGRRIALTGAKNGTLATQGQTLITKTADGQVAYEPSKSGPNNPKSEIQYNRIETPRGGQYELTLSDGSKVWLNAASSIKYPAAFTGNSRQVEITGEAYFEVAHNAAKPFTVVSNGQTVEVLGTHFDVNAYNDEPATRTTLLEGSVKVSDGNGGAMIKPGEQAILKGNAISVVKTDVDDVIAWKNGLTTFENADIYAVMRQVARWYDVKVVFEGEIPARHFSGAVSRGAGIDDVLKILELSKIHFRVTGKTITVTP